MVEGLLTLGLRQPDVVGVRLRTAWRSAGFTQKQLADELGVDAITVSRWERGVTSPSLPRLRRVAELTETTVSDLVLSADASSPHARELAALRAELAETRELLDRIALVLELHPPRVPAREPYAGLPEP